MSRYLRQRALRSSSHPFIGQARGGLPADQREFYENLGREDTIQFDPEIDQDEVFDDQFERRAHEIQRTPGANNAVSVIPSRTGPWTGNNNLGIERAFAPDENNRQTIIKLPEWGFPEMWTLCLGLTYNTDLYDPQGEEFSITATVEFGTGGVIQVLEMDWLQGAAITLPMNALNVIAQFTPGSGGEAGPVALPQDLRLRANVVRGAFSNACPRRSFVDRSTLVVVPVPPFAKSVTLIPRLVDSGFTEFDVFNFYSDPSFVRFVSGDPTIFSVRILSIHKRSQFVEYLNIVDATMGRPVYVDVPEGARFLSIENPGTSTIIVQYRLGV